MPDWTSRENKPKCQRRGLFVVFRFVEITSSVRSDIICREKSPMHGKSQRDFVIQPRVASLRATLGEPWKMCFNRNAVVADFMRDVRNSRNRVAVGNIGGRRPRVASQARQPWALGRNPVGILAGRTPSAPGRRRGRGGFFLIKFLTGTNSDL
jgi:hypothetical protein